MIALCFNVWVFLLSCKRTLITLDDYSNPRSWVYVSSFFTSVIRLKIPGVISLYLQTIVIEFWTSERLFAPFWFSIAHSACHIIFWQVFKVLCMSEWGNWKYDNVCPMWVNTTVNAFVVLIESARQMYLQEHQSPDSSLQPITERNRKDKLYNDIIRFMTSKGLKFNADEVDTSGTKLVRLLCQIFWYIDGHSHVFLLRSLPVPKEFDCFLRYNIPELSKHRKRRTYNLTIDVLQEFTLDLSVILDESYWDREGWCDFNQLVHALLQWLVGYIQYLSGKNKAVRLHHKSLTPVREIFNNLWMRFLSPSCVADSNSPFTRV